MDIDLSSTASAPWNPRFTQSQDVSQLSATAEAKRSDNHMGWHHKQTDFNNNTNSVSRTPTEGDQLTHFSFSCLFQDNFDDN